jgi:hypothetical protein
MNVVGRIGKQFGKQRQKIMQDERRMKTNGFSKRRIFTVVFWIIVLLVIYLAFVSFNRTTFLNNKINAMKSETDKQLHSLHQGGFVQSPAGDAYAQRFITSYINIPSNQTERDQRQERLSKFFAEDLNIHQIENLEDFQGKRVLTAASLYDVNPVKGTTNQADYTYLVSYDMYKDKQAPAPVPSSSSAPTPKVEQPVKPSPDSTPKEEKVGGKMLLLTIRLGTDGKTFNVLEQPSFASSPERASLKAIENNLDHQPENKEKKDELKQFATQFFTSYSQNTEQEMAYLMSKPSSLKGLYQYIGITEFSVYDDKKKGHYILKALVEFQESETGVKIQQPYTLHVSKQNGRYFVNQLKNSLGE